MISVATIVTKKAATPAVPDQVPPPAIVARVLTAQPIAKAATIVKRRKVPDKNEAVAVVIAVPRGPNSVPTQMRFVWP